VLEAIVRDYVSTREPVGSRSIVERYDLGVSPATIRNDMAALEEAGLIHQPHTSAGRVPTDQGYRQFVDSLDSIKPLSAPERRAVRKLLEGAVDLDDVVERAVRALAQVTRQVAVVQYPSLQRVSLRHVEFVLAGARYVILLIVTEAGRVEQRTLRLELDVDSDDLADLGRRFNAQLVGLRLADIAPSLEAILGESPERLRTVVESVGGAILDVLRAVNEERIVMAGAANLSRHSFDFANSISPVLDVLEEQVALLRILAAMQEGVCVSIGEENRYEELAEASVVSSTYDVADQSVARLGVVGPTRMDYPGTMSAVHAISRYLSDILSNR
jgi:heat shock gene repressor HrcA